MELTERLPLDKINYLNSLTFKQYKELDISKSSCKNDAERKIQFNIMKSFCETNIKTRGQTKRIYSFTETTPLEVGGRLYCGNSIQGLSSKIRGFLLNDITTDIDMKNAHPVILRYLCQIHNIDCPNLSYYTINREKILERLGKEFKTEFLKAVNDDKLNKKIKDDFFKSFDKECKAIQKSITSLECYKHIVDTVPSSKEYNWLGSAINRILCVYENKIIQDVITVLNSKQIEISALMFDGLMPYGNYYDDSLLLREIETFINSKYDGLNMEFTYKPHSNVIQIPSDFNADYVEPIIEYEINQDIEKLFEAACDYDFAVFFAKFFGHKIKCVDVANKQWFVFNEKNIWAYDIRDSARNCLSTEMFQMIDKYMEGLIEHMNKFDPTSEKYSFYSKRIKICGEVANKLKRTTDKNNIIKEAAGLMFDEHFMSTLNREKYVIPIKNKKMLNMNTLEVYERTINNKFSYECDVDYIELSAEQEANVNQYFLDLFCGKQDMVDCVMDILKSIFSGEKLRYIFFFTGSGCNGKSLLFKILKSIFSSSMDTISNKIILDLKQNNSITTEFEKLDKCRLAYITELKKDDKLNEKVIKQITGGDAISYRPLYKSEVTIESTANFCVPTNELPSFDKEKAIIDRIQVIPFLNTFTVDSSFESKLLAMKNEIFSFIMKKGTIRDKFNLTEEMIVAKEEYVDENKKNDCLKDFIEETFDIIEFNNNDSKNTSIKRDDFRILFNTWCKMRDLPVDKSDNASFSKRMHKDYGIDNKQLGKKKELYYIGICLKENED
jgi:P4 family phage/plasmid primase-like protien